MKYNITCLVAALSALIPLVSCRLPIVRVTNSSGEGTGTGPYPASETTDDSLSGYTIYMPVSAPSALKMPVIVYGVGGCILPGDYGSEFFNEVASHGFFIITNNGPGVLGLGPAFSSKLTDAADWADKTAGKGKYSGVDTSRMAVAGWSCGGLQAYDVAEDPRFMAIGIFSSGELMDSWSSEVAPTISKPIFYFMGGPSDIAYENGERDYGRLNKNIPAWIGSNGEGHFNTYTEPNGGSMGMAGSAWAQWVLAGDTSSSQFFLDNSVAQASGNWTGIKKQNLQVLKTSAVH